MMMKPMDDSMDEPERARRGAHGPACVNVFSNRLCAEFVGGNRHRRKGHGGSQVCQAIVFSATTTTSTSTTELANRCSVFTTRTECNVAKAQADVLGFQCVFRAGSLDPRDNGCLEKVAVVQPTTTTTTTADSNRCAEFTTRSQCNAAKADAANLGFLCVFRAGSSIPSENGCLEKIIEEAVDENKCAQFKNRKQCNVAKADAENLGFKCVFRVGSGCVEK